MKRVAVILAEGFEEIETISVIDILRRATISVEVFSLGDVKVTGGHGITMIADDVFNYYNVLDFDAIIFPGGMKNAITLSENKDVLKLIYNYATSDKLVCGICATPAIVFSKCDILDGCNFTCYPDEELISEAKKSCKGIYLDEDVVFSGNVLTSQSPATATHFALAICEILGYDSIGILNDLEGK